MIILDVNRGPARCKSKMIPREHTIGIIAILYVNPGYKLSVCQDSSKSVKYFLRDRVHNISWTN